MTQLQNWLKIATVQAIMNSSSFQLSVYPQEIKFDVWETKLLNHLYSFNDFSIGDTVNLYWSSQWLMLQGWYPWEKKLAEKGVTIEEFFHDPQSRRFCHIASFFSLDGRIKRAWLKGTHNPPAAAISDIFCTLALIEESPELKNFPGKTLPERFILREGIEESDPVVLFPVGRLVTNDACIAMRRRSEAKL